MHKIRLLSIGCIGIGCLIVLRLFYLQAHITSYLHTRGQKNFLRITCVQPTRGTIVDCKGRLLATNRVVSNLCWTGSGQKNLSPTSLATAEKLASIIALPHHDELMAAIKRVERTNGSLTLAHDLTFEQLSRIEELFPHDAHIRIITHFKRL
jgi:cell division protein FtsI/penicillin-binding protein 2